MTRDGVENGGRSRSSSDIGNDRMVSDAAPSIGTPDPAREDLAWLLMDMASSGHRNENTTTESRTRSFDDETVFDTEEGESEGSSLDPALAATRTYYKIRMAEAEAAATSLYPEDGSIQGDSIGDSNDDDNGDDDGGGGGDDDDYHDNSEAIRLAALTGRPGFRSTLSGDNDVWKTLSVTSLNAGDGPARGRDRGSSSGSSGDAQGRCNGPDDFDKWIPEALANSPKAVHWYKRWFDFMYNNHRKNLPSIPVKVNFETIDLYNLYFSTCRRGGFDMMEAKDWREVIKEMTNYDPNAVTFVRRSRVVGHYEKLLLNYERANPQDVVTPKKGSSIASRRTHRAESVSPDPSHYPRRIPVRRSARQSKRIAGDRNGSAGEDTGGRPQKVVRTAAAADVSSQIRNSDSINNTVRRRVSIRAQQSQFARAFSERDSSPSSSPSPSPTPSSGTAEHPFGKRLQNWTTSELCEYLRPTVAWKTVLLIRRNDIDGRYLHSMIKTFPHEVLAEALSMDLLKWMKLYVKISKFTM